MPAFTSLTEYLVCYFPRNSSAINQGSLIYHGRKHPHTRAKTHKKHMKAIDTLDK
jgi:hypothetical protein